MLLWKGDQSSIRSANWFVPSSNSTHSVKEEQLNRDSHRGQGGEQHWPFCKQPDLAYIPVKFGYTCGSGRTGLPLLTEAIYVRLGATETPEPQRDNCYTNIDSHQCVTILLPPLLLAPFGNGLVERKAVQSSQNTGCNYFLTFHYFRLQQYRTQSIWFWWKWSRWDKSWWAAEHPSMGTLSMDHPSHIYKVQEGFVPCAAPICLVCSPRFSSWGTAWSLHAGPNPARTENSSSNAELQPNPLCSRHRHNLDLNLKSFMVTQRLKAVPVSWSMGMHQEHPLEGTS